MATANNIEFKKLTLKNFLSVGEESLEFLFNDENRDKTTINIVTGSNGTGKSTLLCDGVSFALFGKSVRGLNKNGLINNITQGNTVVSIEFNVHGSDYIIRRGIKPTFLELYKDGELLNVTALKQDTQTYINSHILRFGFNVFTQTIVLTSMLYQSFMTMNAGARRKYIENITGLNIIANALLTNKDELNVINGEIDYIQTDIDKINIKKSGNEQLLLTNKEIYVNITTQIKELKEQIENIIISKGEQENNEKIQDELLRLVEELDSLNSQYDKMMKEHQLYENELKKYEKIISSLNDEKWQNELIKRHKYFKNEMEYNINQWQDFVESAKYSLNLLNDKIKIHSNNHEHNNQEQCDYCNSYTVQYEDVAVLLQCKEMIVANINTINEQINNAQQAIKQSSDYIAKKHNELFNKYQSKYDEIEENIKNYQHKINLHQQMIENSKQMYVKLKKQHEEYEEIQNKQLEKQINSYGSNIKNNELKLQEYIAKIDKLEEELKTFDSLINDLQEQLTKKSTTQNIMNNTVELLSKEHGGLYSIIEQEFIKLLNYTINKNLKIMGFGGLIYFDENYKETIYTFTKKDVVYNSLSAGERMRIDLSLIFTWQELLSKISNVKSNLFIIDEIADNVLDDDGINAFKKLLLNGDKLNTFIITHNHSFVDKFTDDITSTHDIDVNMYNMKKVNSFTVYEKNVNI